MLRILDRYLLRELAFGFFASTGVLLIVTLGGTFADVLANVARGRVPANLMFELLALRTLGALTVLLPLALFLGVLLAYGRLWRDSEMAVLQASGVSLSGLMRPLILLALPVTVLLAMISFWLAPAGVRLSQGLLQQASRSMVVAGMEPGRFIELPGRAGAIFVGTMSSDGSRFERMFVESERADGDDVRIDVITAESGELAHDSDGGTRYLALKNGFRVEGRIGHDDYRLLRFKANDIVLADSDPATSPDSIKEAAPTPVLLFSDDPLQRAELHWRLAAPVSGLVLMLLALPLSRATPRESRYGKLLVAILCYLIYAAFLGIARNWISQDRFISSFGLWWVHLPTAAIALALLWQSGRLPRRRRAA